MPAKRAKAKPKLKAEFKAKAQARSRVESTRDRAQEQIELGYKTAVSLLAEISLPDGIEPSKESLKGLVRIDEQPDFIRVTKDKQTHYPAKEAIFKAIGKDIGSAVTFCYLTLETDVSKSFDVDHVCPRDYFVQKQKLLLNYLNKNSEFAQGFLGEHITRADEHQKKIGVYFIRDKSSGEIQATKWLCDAFYNSTSNLTYLLHYINREKRAMQPSLWLERKEINEEFKRYLLSQGGVSEGVIMQGVIKGARDKMEQIVLKGVGRGENITVYLHQGEGAYQGLGDFIRGWFLINKAKTIKASKDVSDIKGQLYDILTDEFHDRIVKKEVKLEKILVMINGVFSATKKFLSVTGSSSSDSSIAKKGRGASWQITAAKALRYMSTLKQLKQMILSWIAPSYKENFEQEFYDIFTEKGFPDLPSTCLDEAYRIVEQAFGVDGKENRQQLSRDQFIEFVDKLIDEVDPVKQTMRERALREAAEHKAEEERVQKEQERAEKEAAQREVARLTALLAMQGQQVPSETPDVKAAQSAAGKLAARRPLTRLFATQSMDEKLAPTRRSRSSISDQETKTESAIKRPAKIRRT